MFTYFYWALIFLLPPDVVIALENKIIKAIAIDAANDAYKIAAGTLNSFQTPNFKYKVRKRPARTNSEGQAQVFLSKIIPREVKVQIRNPVMVKTLSTDISKLNRLKSSNAR